MTATDQYDGPFPRYRSHKIVEAAKITTVRKFQNGPPFKAALFLQIGGGQVEHAVSDEYVRKHNPQVGGYWVRYPDGYESWSPAEAFESGYTLVDADDEDERHRRYVERERQVKAGGARGHDVIDLPAERVWPVVVKVAGRPIIEIDPDGVVEVKGHVLKAQT